MKTGKLDSKQLEELVLSHITYTRPEVLASAAVGEDCAVVSFGEYDCILSTDPITAAVDQIGSLAVHISCNDIAANGAEPLGIMLAVMVPPSVTEQQLDEMMRQAGETAEEMGVAILGGHTEVTEAVNKPVIVSTAIGRTKKNRSVEKKRVTPGEAVIMTKMAGIEGTGIIASDLAHLLRGFLTEEEIGQAKGFLSQISVVKEGLAAGRAGATGMHDITEGGILGAAWEMCEVAGTGLLLYEEKIPVAEVTEKICAHLGLDCLRLISSGCMMITVAKEQLSGMLSALEAAGVSAAVIGETKEMEFGRLLEKKDGSQAEIDPPGADELYKVI